MELEVIKNEKDDLELTTDNGTVAEVLRIYLNEDSNVKKAVWRRDHPSKPILMKVMTASGKTAKKAISDAVVVIGKDLDALKKIK